MIDDYRAHLRSRLLSSDVPLPLHSGLLEYFAARRPTGDFLRAVLCNDLRDACGRADDVNRYELHTIVAWLNRYVPAPAWGSADAVAAWLASTDPVIELFE